jgi:hypothetical protein
MSLRQGVTLFRKLVLTYADLNPAAIQRKIQALTAKLLILTTSKAAATSKPGAANSTPQESATATQEVDHAVA